MFFKRATNVHPRAYLVTFTTKVKQTMNGHHFAFLTMRKGSRWQEI